MKRALKALGISKGGLGRSASFYVREDDAELLSPEQRERIDAGVAKIFLFLCALVIGILGLGYSAFASTLGTTSVGGSSCSASGNYLTGNQVTVGASNIDVSSLAVYFSGVTSGQYKLAIYNDTGSNVPNALIAQTSAASAVDGWNFASTTAPTTLTAGTKYWIMDITDDNSPRCAYDAGSFWSYSNVGSFTLPGTYSETGQLARIQSIYLIYTAGGGGGTSTPASTSTAAVLFAAAASTTLSLIHNSGGLYAGVVGIAFGAVALLLILLMWRRIFAILKKAFRF